MMIFFRKISPFVWVLLVIAACAKMIGDIYLRTGAFATGAIVLCFAGVVFLALVFYGLSEKITALEQRHNKLILELSGIRYFNQYDGINKSSNGVH